MRRSFVASTLVAVGALVTMGTVVACGAEGLDSTPNPDAGGGPDAAIPPADAGADGAQPAQYTISGTVAGLGGTGLVLANGSEKLSIPKGATAFSFTSKVTAGGAYTVVADAQPTGPSQTCSVTNGSGTANADVSDVSVVCTTNAYDISVNVVGAEGAGLVLRNNGGDDLAVSANADTQKVTFATKIASGQPFDVTIATQPLTPDQLCTVAGGSGTVLSGNVESITVNCTKIFTVSGTVNGLAGSGLVLQNNGGDDVAVTAAGGFAFAKPVVDGQPYAVTVKNGTNPTSPWQTCAVTSGGSGTISGANVTDVVVDCTTNTYAVTGTLTGLSGTGLVLTNNGGDDLPVDANGSFKFVTSVLSGAAFDVKVKSQPTGPWQTCTVSSGSGTIAGTDAAVTVDCAINTYSVGGTVWGLRGKGLVLSANGTPLAPIDAQGDFHVDLPSGATYSFALETQPTSPAQSCILSKASGSVAGSNVTSVTVGCGTTIVVGAVSPQSWLDDVANKLTETGAFASVGKYNAYLTGTPTLAQIQAYDSMLLFSDYGYQDPTAMGNIAADYFDGGGRVVMATFANASVPIGGRWSSEGYHLIEPKNQKSPGSQAALTFDEPGTWLVRDSATLKSTSAYMSTGGPINGGVVVARWGTGDPLVVRGTKNGVSYAALNFYPPSISARNDFWEGDGAQLMRNALTYK